MTLQYDIFETQFGWVGLVASDKGLRRTTLPQASPEDCAEELGNALDNAVPSPDRFEGLMKKVMAYF
ncbi:MAG: hypothetical protein IIC22_03540, partial [Chloroflexi bacterium]|nr:hypothetical protein [Chloroflexota bacterium]